MRIEAVLRAKHRRVITVRMTDTVLNAARRLRAEDVGLLVVKDTCATEGDAVLGVLSERDILQAIVDHGMHAMKLPVSRLMTLAVFCCDLDDSVERALTLMHAHHIRHLPVLDNGSLVGVVSMRDLVAPALQGPEHAERPELALA